MTDLTKLTLTEARDGLAKKTFTSTELTDAFIAAIDKANPAINAFVMTTPPRSPPGSPTPTRDSASDLRR